MSTQSAVDSTLTGSVRSGGTGGSVALDQWRGVALILVLISHGLYFTHRVSGAGRIGVNLFFFISGILVFRSLQSSKASGWQFIRRFWWHRVRRLYPALIAYLVLLLLLLLTFRAFHLTYKGADVRTFFLFLPAALTYTTDYAHDVPIMIGHLWSLSVEVQFYVFAPLLYLTTGSSRRIKRWLFCLVLCAFVVYGFVRPLHTSNLEAIRYHFEIAAWPMMLGFCCEFAKKSFGTLGPAAVRWLYFPGVVTLPAALIVMTVFRDTKLLVIFIGTFLLVPCLIAYLYELPFPGKTGRTLAWFGERTYSIYLLQQPLTIAGFFPVAIHPATALLAIAAGSFWFNMFEKPFLSISRTRQIRTTFDVTPHSSKGSVLVTK